jgi:uncharacterized membrane protein YvlD (DUF360 family)
VTERSYRESLAPVAAATLLILTAWGNALAMFVVGVVGLLLALLVSPKASRRPGVMTAMLGAVVVVVVLMIIKFMS